MNLKYYFTDSRWIWLLRGLPSIPRAQALFRIRRYTMTTPTRSAKLWDLCRDLSARHINGALVECGVWRGGCAGLMSLACRHFGADRPLHLFDSFEGLPEPTQDDGADAAVYSGGHASGRLVSIDQCKASEDTVRTFLFDVLKLEPGKVSFHRGWFQDTVPKKADDIGPIALLRLDGDWYDSTKVCLENLYPHVVKGGVIILDDYYYWSGCKKATEEFRTAQKIEDPLVRIDQAACYWIKS